MKIHRVCLRTEQLTDLRRFYGETLALPLHEVERERFTVSIGASELQFQTGAAAAQHFAFNIPSAQFAAAQRWLTERAPLLPLPQGGHTMHWRAWNAHACYFRDPAGNIGELIARHNLTDGDKSLAGQPFDPATQLLGISEVGLALADVSAACRQIQDALGLPVWDAGDGVRFRAMGSEQGLLICVLRGHAWFPTEDVLATPTPLQIVFAGPEERELILPGTGYELRVEVIS